MLHIKSNILQLIHLQIQVQADSKLVQIGPIYCKKRQNNRAQRTELRLLKLAKNRQSLKKQPLLVGHIKSSTTLTVNFFYKIIFISITFSTLFSPI